MDDNKKLVWGSDEIIRICNDNNSYSPQMEQELSDYLKSTMDFLDEQVIYGIGFGNSRSTKTNEVWTGNSTCTSETGYSSENIVKSMTNAILHIEEIERKSKTVFYIASDHFKKLKDGGMYIDKSHTVADSDVLIINTEDVELIKETFESEGFILEEINANELFYKQSLYERMAIDASYYTTELPDISNSINILSNSFTSLNKSALSFSTAISAINVSMDFGSSSNKHNNVFSFVNCKLCINFEELPASGRRWANKLRRKGWKRSGKDWYCPNCEYRVANNE